MSGGSYDYVFGQISDAADKVERRGRPLDLAFAHHLRLVSKAMHDVEWVDSGDYANGDEDDAIKAVLSPPSVLAAMEISEARLVELLGLVQEHIQKQGISGTDQQ